MKKAAQVLAREFIFIDADKAEGCPHGFEDYLDCPLCGVFDPDHISAIDAYCEEYGRTASPSQKAQVLRAILGAQR